ncbi:MAG: hypothetical protein ABSF45_07220 [Terriglobia bacterium]|jgi:hypothetical protein
MKLRIQGNSLRLRLTRKEVAQLHDCGRVESSIEFAPGRTLAYALEGSPQATAVSASFDGRAILVAVPMPLLMQWAEGDQVSIEGPPQASVQLLIEKDFQCLHKADHQDPDAYPNPLAP